MFTYNNFLPEHIFQLDLCNLDKYSENFTLDYYLNHMLKNYNKPFYCCMHASINKLNAVEYANNLTESTQTIYGYIFGYKINKFLKIKEEKNDQACIKFSGIQMSALSVSFLNRNLGLGKELVKMFEQANNEKDFIKLFVREGNKTAINFYVKNGFKIKRKIKCYYFEPKETALEMIKMKKHELIPENDIDVYFLSDTSS